MADIASTGTGHNKHYKHRTRVTPMIDLTPMVDLAFLLITFFMLATTLQRPTYLDLDKRIATKTPAPVPECCVLNILIDSANHIYTYQGSDIKNLRLSSFNPKSGIEFFVIEKSKQVKNDCGLDENKKPYTLICLIKLLPGARYKNLVDMMDIMNFVKPTPIYSVQEPTPDEIATLQEKEKDLLAVR